MGVSPVKFLVTALIFLLPLTGAAQVSSDTSDFPEATLDADDRRATFSGGIGGPADGRMFAQRWVYVDGTGLSAPARNRLRDALDCEGDGTSRLTRLVCALGQDKVGAWRKADGSPEWLVYTTVNRRLLKRLRWCEGNGTCSQTNRIQVFARTWAQMQAHPRCGEFYGLRCLGGAPPVVLFKVSPNVGEPPE